MYKDPFTGRYHTHYRDYDPVTNRWLSEDPAGYMDGLNLYGACMGVNGRDPLGLALYAFDGTGNHPNPTNIDGSSNSKTNVRILYEAYAEDKVYAYGLGTGYTVDGKKYETLAGLQKGFEGGTGSTMEDRVAYMMKELEKRLANGDKVVDVTGFSRGAASATLFLNKIQEQIDKGNKLYDGIDMRFVAIFDQVPSKSSVTGQLVGRALDTAGYALTLTMWSPDTYARNANNEGFTIPKRMKFSNRPWHLIALDEKRKEFAVSDVTEAHQIGFRGVHSDVGGYYGSLFELITRDFIVNAGKKEGVKFNNTVLTEYNAANLFYFLKL